MKNNITCCYVAGKSGGHLIPALTTAKINTQKSAACSILFFSTSGSLDKTIVNQSDLSLIHIPLSIEPVPYKQWWRFPLFFLKAAMAFFKSLYFLYRYRPKSIASFGGLVSLPVGFAGWCLRIPIDLYLLDTTVGAAAKKLAPLAQTIYTCFPDVQKELNGYTCISKPYPIKFLETDRTQSRIPIYKALEFNAEYTTILILGGSQGSQFINDIGMQTMVELHALIPHIQIIHQVGSHSINSIKNFYDAHHIKSYVFNFSEHIGLYYRIAQLAICRSGAGTLFELLFFKVPTITIPLQTYSTDHQLHNARTLHKMHPNLIYYIKQKQLETSPHLLAQQCLSIVQSSTKTA